MSDIPTLSNVSPKGQITVPAEMRRTLGIEPGGKVRFVLKGRQLLVEAYEEPPLSSLFGLARARKGAGVVDLDAALDEAMRERAAEKDAWPK
ncbi:AbrB/MazE/SpoVT family DNA-binding domain-containing protein [Hydrocarboniphaga sp.]|uniref:AbrB/MazE/SpoVT family DNA-binding domain-containing protein n=1 Tax=Hydrocarboniphaga sp. TaxID=2033016 RepID=UPI003D0C3A2C